MPTTAFGKTDIRQLQSQAKAQRDRSSQSVTNGLTLAAPSSSSAAAATVANLLK
jgi:hypothetical protein